MAAESGRTAPHLTPDEHAWLERLLAQPGSFDFHVALRRFDAADPGRPRLGAADRPSDEPLRLGQLPSAAFAGAELDQFAPGVDGRPPQLTVAFLGLWGPNGPLPAHMTEYAHDRLTHAGDATLVRFADIFHHRLLLLFYRAWAMGQPTASMDRPESDAFARYVGALMGLGLAATRGRSGASDYAKLRYAPFLAGSRCPEGLRDMLADYFGVGVRIEEWIGGWLDLPDDERWRLGGPARTAALGQATLGARVWSRGHKFRIRFGPLTAGQLEHMLPGSDALGALASLVRLYTNDEWDWDVRLVMAAADAAPLRLGRQGRLGWTTRLGSGPQVVVDLLVDPQTGSTRRIRSNSNAVDSP
jgi:type VI secretion system protein ImpH